MICVLLLLEVNYFIKHESLCNAARSFSFVPKVTIEYKFDCTIFWIGYGYVQKGGRRGHGFITTYAIGAYAH
jgi:hypothetical protein